MNLDGHFDSFERNPTVYLLKAGVVVAILVAGVATTSWLLGWGAETAQVVREEFGPREALRKYTWLKEAAAQLDKKVADIKIYESRLQTLNDAYPGVPRGKWARDDREQWSVWSSELAGIKASYNQLAAEYNAKMAEVNWSFAEVGKLPPGATTPLPRDYKPYMDK